MKRLFLLVLLLMGISTAHADMSVHFLSVGHGDCAIVVADGEAMIIDGGNPSDSDLVYGYLQRLGVKTIKAAIGTHPDSDHIGGLPAAFHATQVQTLYVPMLDAEEERHSVLLNTARKQGAETVVPPNGHTFALGSASVTLIRQQDETLSDNNRSIVTLVEYGKTRFLFCADIETDVEEILVGSGLDLRADVLKVAHHGSESSSSPMFLLEVFPSYAVISGDETYADAAATVPKSLISIGAVVLNTHKQGHIVITSDGDRLTVEVQRRPAEKAQPDQSGPASYIGNRNSKVFHRPTCKSVKAMKDKNKVAFASRDDAISIGYKPCKNCKP